MRKIKEILRLKFACGLSNRQIAGSCSISHSTVGDYLDRFEKSGLSWPLAGELDELSLELRLFPMDRVLEKSLLRPEPDWKYVHEELRRKGVTLQLLWREYLSENKDKGYRYSQFCQLYGEWKRSLHVSMRQKHRAGEKMFVDYCGQTVPIKNSSSEDIKEALIFVAVLGASNYIFAEGHLKQDIAHWIGGHIRAFEFFEGVPEIVVPDNLKAGVKSPCRYEPVINPSYQDMAEHYQVAVIPARVRKPKDKAKVEVGVQIVQRWILAVLRKRTFFSLHELNQQIKELLVELNNREMKQLGKSRRELFENLEKPQLKALPDQPFQFWEWKRVQVPADYHIKFDNNYYSVPAQYVQKTIDIRANQSLVEIYFKDKVIAYHKRSYEKNFTITKAEHMPKKHRAIAEVNAQNLLNWAEKVGSQTYAFIQRILSSEKQPEQTYRRCLGVLRLGTRYGEDRLEAACKRSLHFGGHTYKGVEAILKNGCDKFPLPDNNNQSYSPISSSLPSLPSLPSPAPVLHENIRGSQYYQQEVA
jgi:transposase